MLEKFTLFDTHQFVTHYTIRNKFCLGFTVANMEQPWGATFYSSLVILPPSTEVDIHPAISVWQFCYCCLLLIDMCCLSCYSSCTYSADSWCDILPTIFHERQWPISNHVVYIIIQTISTWRKEITIQSWYFILELTIIMHKLSCWVVYQETCCL